MATEGTKENPWKLKTPPLSSEYEMYKDVKDGKEVIMCIVGKTTLMYDANCLTDLQECLKNMAIGWNLEVLMNKSLQKKQQWKPGAVRKKIRMEAGMV